MSGARDDGRDADPVPARRLMLYSHDSYGLGHLRRTMLIGSRLARLPEVSDVLIATGSPRAQAFDVAEGVDTVKLPAITKDAAGRYVSRTLGLPLDATIELRKALLLAVADAFRPDLVLVDHTPLGLGDELRPALERLRGHCRLVLGLRDVVDDAATVSAQWAATGTFDDLASFYDRVLVYGDPAVTTTAQELGLEHRLPGRVQHVGYVARTMPERCRSGSGELPVVLVTVGGGGDGQRLLRTWFSYLRARGTAVRFRSVVLTGPFLSPARRLELVDRAHDLVAPVDIVPFSDRPELLMAAAAAAVSMGGYNSVCELMHLGVPTLVVPREKPRREQLVRAERLAAVRAVQTARLGELDHATIDDFVERALAGDRRPVAVDLGGLDGVAGAVSALLARRLDGSRPRRSRCA